MPTPNTHGNRQHTSTAGDLRDAQIIVMREVFNWIGDTDSVNAIMLLDLLTDPHAHYLAIRLARELHDHRPAAITRDLSPLLTLAVAVGVTNAGGVSPVLNPDNAEQLAWEVAQLSHRIRGLYDTEAAATQAQRTIGGAARVEPAFQAGYLLCTPATN